MEKRIKEAFDILIMPDACTAEIERAMQRHTIPHSPRRTGWRMAAAAACLLLVLTLCCNPAVVQALEEVFFPVTPGMDNAFYISANWSSYYRNGGGGEGDHNWILPSGTISGRLDPDPWLVQEEDRLCFTANGEKIDITDRISFETPFTYTYVDKQDLIHYLAVGGEFDADQGVESVGTIEYVRHKGVMEANPGSIHAGWLFHVIRGSDAKNMQDKFYPWVYKAFDILDLPIIYLEPESAALTIK